MSRLRMSALPIFMTFVACGDGGSDGRYLTGVGAASAGASHACAMGTGGQVYCWGDNLLGQLGAGLTTSDSVPLTLAAAIDTKLRSVVSIAAGGEHTCASLRDETVSCWGHSTLGDLGTGTSQETFAMPTVVPGLAPVTAVFATGPDKEREGAEYSCALMADRTARCWGDSMFGLLLTGNTAVLPVVSTPEPVPGVSHAQSLAPGGSFACALLEDGTVQCWGSTSAGTLGDIGESQTRTPVAVKGLSGVKQVASGEAHACALLNDGSVSCWGSTADGRLGIGATPQLSVSIPVNVAGLSGAKAITAGLAHTCALLGDGSVRCWGQNGWGQLGDSAVTAQHVDDVSTRVAGVQGATSISAGADFTCAVLSDQTVTCWGRNDRGQCGQGYVSAGAGLTAVQVRLGL